MTVSLQFSAGDLRIEPKDSAHLLLLSGQDSREPV